MQIGLDWTTIDEFLTLNKKYGRALLDHQNVIKVKSQGHTK